MSITFRCERCRQEVKAPDDASGKRGLCPFCGHTTYVPAPVREAEPLPLAPVDEEEERRRQERVRELLRQEHDLLAEAPNQAETPLEHREDLASDDLHHFVVNYCLDLFQGRLERADTYAPKLKRFGELGRRAVEDFASGKAIEPALDAIPQRVLAGFLAQLRDSLR